MPCWKWNYVLVSVSLNKVGAWPWVRAAVVHLGIYSHTFTARMKKLFLSFFEKVPFNSQWCWRRFSLFTEGPHAGLSLRLQVAGYFLFVTGEVASSHGAPPPLPTPTVEVQLLRFSKRHYRPKKAFSSRVQLSLAVLWWSRLYYRKLQHSATLK